MSTQAQPKPTEQRNPATEQHKVPFNPFTHLNADENAALTTRINPQWKAAHDGQIRLNTVELQCEYPEAMVYTWLKELAADQLEAQIYNRIFTSNKAMLEQVAAGSEASLVIIAEDYVKLPATIQRKYRINLRDVVTSKWFGETAKRIMDKIMAATGVQPEKEWMR